MPQSIFIADDDPDMVDLYNKIFKLYGYEVMEAHDGEEAAQKLESLTTAPIVIFLDIMMPKMDGYGVFEHVKKIPLLKGVPVVFLTNLSSPEGEAKAVEMGVDMYLSKSDNTPKQIMDKVLEMLKDKGITK